MTTITILATGLGQGRISNGMATARHAIIEANPTAIVRVLSYKCVENIPTIAKQIIKADPYGVYPIIMAWHSWGATLCCPLAKWLGYRYGRQVRVMLSADGVNRPPRVPLVIPNNVMELQSWYQTKGVIKGSLLCTGIFTKHEVHQQVHVGHARVDETPAFQAAVLKFAMEEKT